MNASSQTPRSIFAKIVAFISSFGLATALLILLLLITLLGTLEQVEHGLYVSQTKYFESNFIWSIDIGACLRAMSIPMKDFNLPVLLPGGYLVMAVFALNIIAGGLIRVRKNPRTIGVIIAHFSMVFMLVAGAVSYHLKKDGNMPLFEGQTSDQFQSFHDRVIEIEQVEPAAADGKRQALVIPMKHFQDLVPTGGEGKARTFTNSALPFDVILSNYAENCEPKRADGSETREVVDGYFLQPKTFNPTAEQNIDGIYVTVKPKTGEPQKGILWGAGGAPWTAKVDGKTFLFDLTRLRWQLPFAVKLDQFDREVHPGTDRASKFSSHVTKIVGTHEEKKIISMNEPLRDSGYVLFQASFNMDQAGGSARKQSIFAVVQNPSDYWPLYSCLAVAVGLLIHFGQMVVRFARRQPAAGNKPSATSVA